VALFHIVSIVFFDCFMCERRGEVWAFEGVIGDVGCDAGLTTATAGYAPELM
jgi:hypothetical protein